MLGVGMGGRRVGKPSGSRSPEGRGQPGLRVQAWGRPGAEVRTTGVSPGQPHTPKPRTGELAVRGVPPSACCPMGTRQVWTCVGVQASG